MKKVLVIAFARSGYHYFQSLLEQHSDLITYGEMSNEGNDLFIRRNPIESYEKMNKWMNEEAIELNKKCFVFKCCPSIFINDSLRHKSLWNDLLKDDPIIIYLDRNRLEQFISFELAKKEGFGGVEYNCSIDLNLNKYLLHSNHINRSFDTVRSYAENISSINLNYSLLDNDPQKTMNYLFDKIELSNIDINLDKATIKQRKRHISSYINNIKKVKDEVRKIANNSNIELLVPILEL